LIGNCCKLYEKIGLHDQAARIPKVLKGKPRLPKGIVKRLV
jgi:hypothetical protein